MLFRSGGKGLGGDVFKPRVSVVVPVRNRAGVVRDCIESILRSDYDRSLWELICVDNGSVDGTRDILASYESEIRMLDEPRSGPAPARNTGIRAATGDVIAFTDSDCVVERDWLRRIVQPLSDPAVGAVGGRILAHNPANTVALFGEIIHDHYRAIEGFSPPYFITMNLACRRDLLFAVGLFDERLLRCEDGDLAYRILQQMPDLHFHYAHAARIRHRNRDSLASLMKEGFEHGYHGTAVRRLHEDFIHRCERRGTRNEDPALANGQQAMPMISEWRRRLYSHAFVKSKQLGQKMGRQRANELIESCTTPGT